MFVGRYVLPFVLRYYMKRFSKKFYERTNNDDYEQAYNKKEGEVKVDYSNDQKKKQNTDIGEYVDYEEIK